MILGMKVRKPDLHDMLKFHPKVLEFHFSDSDINLELDSNFDQQLIVHCYEYFDRKIVDLVALAETNQIHSKEKTIELLFKEGKIINQKGGTALVLFPKWKKPTIEKNNLKDKNIKNAYMVIKVNKKKLIDSHIITAGHDFKDVHKKSRKKFH